MKRARILVVGSSNTDLVVRTPRIPPAGETVLGGDLLINPGGKGANQAVAAARLGADVLFLARIGSDMFGDRSVESIATHGVSTEYVVRDANTPSGVALISVDDSGRNAIVVAPGSNARLTVDDVERSREAFQRADVVVIQCEIPLAAVRAAIDLANDVGKLIILNPAPAPLLPPDFLLGVDILTPNLQEAAALLGRESNPEDMARALLDLGVAIAVITLGEDGAVVAGSQRLETIPTRRVVPVDTTAAGDCFTGALAVAFAETRSISQAVAFANAAASISVTRIGAQSSMPTRVEVDAVI